MFFLLLFILFQNVLFNLLPLPEILNYWDEFLTIIALIIALLFSTKIRKKTVKTDSFYYISSIVIIVITGLLGNFLFMYQTSTNVIIRDILGFLKFPLVFLLLKMSNIDNYLASNIKKGSIVVLKILVALIFVLGIISIFKNIGLSQNDVRNGLLPYQFLFSHPTYLVTTSVLIISILEKYDKSKMVTIFQLMCLVNIGLTMRTKGFAFIAVFLFLKYAIQFVKKHKKISLLLILIIIGLVGYNKFSTYASYSTSAREVLYFGSFKLFKDCFPIGSGFGTYASHLSGKNNSKVYDFIVIPYNAYEGSTMEVLGDTGYPYYIGQFGLIGIICLIIIFYYIYKKSCESNENQSSYFILLYILITLTSESILIGNGFELALILAIVSATKEVKK